MSITTHAQTKTPTGPSSALMPARSRFVQRRQGLAAQLKPLTARPPLIQPKLVVGPPNDKYEQEADRVADQVMRMPEPIIQPKPT